LSRPRNASLDLARCWASLGVVAIHVTARVATMACYTSRAWWFTNLVQSLVFWAVPFFILTSGYFLLGPPTEESAASFYANHLSKLGIPLLAWGALYIAMEGAWKADACCRIAKTALLSGNISYHLYFLVALLGLHLLTPLLRKALALASGPVLIGLGCAFLGAMVFDFAACQLLSQWGQTAGTLPLWFLGYYLVGAGFHRLTRPQWDHLLPWVPWAVLLGWIADVMGKALEAMVRQGSIPYYYGNSYFCPQLVLLSLGLFAWFLHSERLQGWGKSPVVAPLVELSFGLYLAHVAILQRLQAWPTPWNQLTIAGMAMNWLVTVVLSLAIVKVLGSLPLLSRLVGIRSFTVAKPLVDE
jgi:surface polysaccharide O-acyltransferase-like enzyme